MAGNDGTAGRQPHQLPPGRHGLPRSFVVQNQRERLLAAVADVVSECGYPDMSVEAVISSAGVSRRTFYEHFKNKHDAFLAAYDAVVQQLVAKVAAAVADEKRFESRLRAGLAAFLDFLASEPAFARMCIVEVLAAGPEAVRRRNDALRAFAALIEENAREILGAEAPPPLTAETVVGGIYEVVHTRVLRDQADELPRLLPDLTYSAMLPYAGPTAAAEAHRRLREAAA